MGHGKKHRIKSPIRARGGSQEMVRLSWKTAERGTAGEEVWFPWFYLFWGLCQVVFSLEMGQMSL